MVELHQPALVSEALDCLITRLDGRYVDGTVGTGGHAAAILLRLEPSGRLLCVDQDPDSLEVARTRLGDAGDQVHFHRGSFSDLGLFLSAEGWDTVDGILLDLGLNSWSLSQPGKGLSYQTDAPLSMALDPDLQEDAAEVIARRTEAEIVRIFEEFGEVRRPRLYARRIVEARERRPVRSTGDLVRALAGDRPPGLGPSELSRLFQALRVEVCHEMERLDAFLADCADWIRPGGRLAVIAYASHEDRRVKGLGKSKGEDLPFRPLRKSPVTPGREEVLRNRRARSAKLRCFERGWN